MMLNPEFLKVGPIQVERIHDGHVKGALIVSEVGGDRHSQPYQHPCLH
jgi:hypothetical protein